MYGEGGSRPSKRPTICAVVVDIRPSVRLLFMNRKHERGAAKKNGLLVGRGGRGRTGLPSARSWAWGSRRMQREGTGVCSVDGRRKWLIDDKNLSWPFYPENEVMERRERERALCAFVRLSDLEPAASPSLRYTHQWGSHPFFPCSLFPLLFVFFVAARHWI